MALSDTSTADSPTTILPIPHLPPSATELPSLVTKYKTLRLSALQLDPAAFSSTYDRESQFTYETWVSRAQNPRGTTYIALSRVGSESISIDQDHESHGEHELQRLLEHEWIGQITLLGPEVLVDQVEREKPWMPFLGGGNVERESLKGVDTACREGRSVAYMVMGMFVLPRWRGMGVGRRLIEEALGGIRGEKTIVVAMVEQENHAARRLYNACGFRVWDDAVEVQSRGEESKVLAMGRHC